MVKEDNMKKQAKRIVPFNIFSISLIIAIAIAFSTPVLAQQKGSENRQEKSQWQTQSFQKQQDQTTNQQNRQDRNQNQEKSGQFAPLGWVTVGYDYNNDGIYDAFEMISMYDFQKRKGQRQDSASAGSSNMQQDGRSRGGKATADARKKDMVKGKIMKLKTLNIVNSNRQHVIAKVNTDRGSIANVDLGPKEDLDKLDLQQGSQIKIFGVEGTIDRNGFLMADRLQVNGQRMTIDRKEYRPVKKYAATILKTRSLAKKEIDNTLARVQLEDGIKTTVNLGPADSLPQLSEGQQIQFLGRVTDINGKKALIADSLRMNGQTYPIDWGKARTNSQQAAN